MITTVIASICGGAYVLYVGRSLILPPVVTFDNISDGTAFEYPLVILEGVTKRTKTISINKYPITLTPEGTFSHDILLSPGTNTLLIDLEDNFSVKKSQKFILFCRFPCKPYIPLRTEDEEKNQTTKSDTLPIDVPDTPRDTIPVIRKEENSVENSSPTTSN